MKVTSKIVTTLPNARLDLRNKYMDIYLPTVRVTLSLHQKRREIRSSCHNAAGKRAKFPIIVQNLRLYVDLSTGFVVTILSD